jgi:16S rRNA (cytosine1402-N4)-methyltransferase
MMFQKGYLMMHYSVLKQELIQNLKIKENGIYVDATVGYAGDSIEILKRIKKGFLYAFDADPKAVEYSTNELSKISENFTVFEDNFEHLKSNLQKVGVLKVDGIIFDLGLSSPEIDEVSRGFSFMNDAPLDMRMSSKGKSAKDIIDTYSESELTDIFYKYGEEAKSKFFARNIFQNKKNINTTLELVEVIKSSVGANYFYKTHPERKIFQALRIEVNEELKVLESAIPQAIDMLKPGGRICIITFHSLEDRVVKQIFKKYSEVPEPFKGEIDIPLEYKPKLKNIYKKPILPSEKELNENSRSHSAKLRVGERI